GRDGRRQDDQNGDVGDAKADHVFRRAGKKCNRGQRRKPQRRISDQIHWPFAALRLFAARSYQLVRASSAWVKAAIARLRSPRIWAATPASFSRAAQSPSVSPLLRRGSSAASALRASSRLLAVRVDFGSSAAACSRNGIAPAQSPRRILDQP